jgi:hypothetical protein
VLDYDPRSLANRMKDKPMPKLTECLPTAVAAGYQGVVQNERSDLDKSRLVETSGRHRA